MASVVPSLNFLSITTYEGLNLKNSLQNSLWFERFSAVLTWLQDAESSPSRPHLPIFADSSPTTNLPSAGQADLRWGATTAEHVEPCWEKEITAEEHELCCWR